MSDDSGPAATIVTTEITELRATCDRLSIDWHHRNSEDTLRKRIHAKVESNDTGNDEEDESMTSEPALPSYVKNKKPKTFQAPEGIPADIKEALEYMNSFHLARAKRVTEYIESLLNARTRS